MVNEKLEEAERNGTPIDEVPDEVWYSVFGSLADHLPREKDWPNLDLIEKQGAKLMLSDDQKRVRPVIGTLLMEAAGTGMDQEEAVQLNTSVEGVHFYSKGIDDIEDEDDIRNGEVTLHTFLSGVYGDERDGLSRALNYYLSMKTRNYSLITGIDEESLDFETKEKIREAMEKAEDELVDGQNLDLDSQEIGRKDEMTPNYLGGEYDVFGHLGPANRMKTGALFADIGRITEIVGDIPEGTVEEWGYKAGEAFQVEDDVIDIRNQRFSDIESNNYSVPLYIAERFLHTHSDPEKNQLGEEFTEIMRAEENTEEELQRAYEIIEEETPALEASENLAEYLAEQAKTRLDEAEWEVEPYVEIVKGFTDKLTYEREK